jgi:hypothetical protein
MLFGDHRPANKLQKLFAAAWDLIQAGRGDLPLPVKIPPADAPPEDCFLSLCFDIAAAQKLPSPVRLKGDTIFTRIRENMALKLPAPRAFSPPTAQEIRDLAGEYQCLDGMPADHVVPWWAILDDVAATAAQVCYDFAELMEATPPQQHVATVPAAQPGDPVQGKAVETPTANTKPRKAKRSTQPGGARLKLIAALTEHHEYAKGGCLNLDPIGHNELARLADVGQGSANRFFDDEFGGYENYRTLCADKERLIAALKLLNQEFTPQVFLYGARPPGEGERDD